MGRQGASNACGRWQDSFLVATDQADLAQRVQAAISELLPPGGLPQETRAEITHLFLATLARAPNLDSARMKAAKAVVPLSMLGDILRRQQPRPSAAVEEVRVTAEDVDGEPPEMPADYREKFESVFTDSLCQFVRERLEPFLVPEEGKSALPFLLSPTFAEVFIQVVAQHLAPTMLSARRIAILAQTIAYDQLTREVFLDQFLRPEKDNVILYLWDDRWAHYLNILAKGPAGRAGGKGGKAEKGGLFGFFAKKDKKKAGPAVSQQDELAEHAEGLWDVLRSQAGPDTYEAPRLSDVAVLRALFRYEPRTIRDCQSGIRQMLAQESGGSGDGREGASRQYLCKLVRAMPAHCGELIALWAYFTCGADFSAKILKGFQTSYGSSREEQEKAIPFFTRWTPKA